MEVSFIKFNYINMLNQYLANIYILKHNLYNLYFNLIGEGSDSFKKEILEILNKLNNIYINMSLLIKKIGGYPITNLDEIKNISSIKLISSKDYTLEYTNKLLLNDFKLMNCINNQVGEYALKHLDLKSINLILEINKFLEERILILNTNS